VRNCHHWVSRVLFVATRRGFMSEDRAALALATSRRASTARVESAVRVIHRRKRALICAVLCFNLCACRSGDKLPDKSSEKYVGAVSAFYVGLGALQVGDDIHAESKLSEFTSLVPDEPAGWANWGVLALRQRKLDIAAQRLERARSLAPKDDQIYQLLGYMESSRGNSRPPSPIGAKPSSLIPATTARHISWRKKWSARAVPIATQSI